MNPRILPALLVLPALLAAAGAASSPDCEDALDRVRAEHDALGDPWTAELALALGAAMDACSRAPEGPVWPQATGVACVTAPNPPSILCPRALPDMNAWHNLPKRTGDACGWTSTQPRTMPGAEVWGFAIISGTVHQIQDEGNATATYTPSTDTSTYVAEGEVWGLIASGVGDAAQPGFITIHGVMLNAWTWAAAGCTAEQDSLCWAQGNGRTQIRDAVTIYLQGMFYAC